jgi:hypothetical protein
MRRAENTEKYVFDEQGLFPSPNNFYTLGLFCTKALASNNLLNIPFNPAFFKLLKKEEID